MHSPPRCSYTLDMRVSLRFLMFGLFPVLALWAAVTGRYGKNLDVSGVACIAVSLFLFLLPAWAIYANDRKATDADREQE